MVRLDTNREQIRRNVILFLTLNFKYIFFCILNLDFNYLPNQFENKLKDD